MRYPLWMRIRARISPSRRKLKRTADEISDSWKRGMERTPSPEDGFDMREYLAETEQVRGHSGVDYWDDRTVYDDRVEEHPDGDAHLAERREMETAEPDLDDPPPGYRDEEAADAVAPDLEAAAQREWDDQVDENLDRLNGDFGWPV